MADSPVKILYIEDDEEARYLMADIIRYKGYQYYEAKTGIQGIKLAHAHQPDLILIDLRLPDIQGYEVTTHLKSFQSLKDTPIIALTADTLQKTKNLVLTAGCEGYITKPINVNEFLFKLDEYLAGKKDSIEVIEKEQYLKQYTVELVKKLKQKIDELETTNKNLSILNEELFKSREQMMRYNDHLFYLNNIANQLRRLRDPLKLLEQLPSQMIKGFNVDRCFIMHKPEAKQAYEIASVAPANLNAFREVSPKISSDLLDYLNEENGVIWIKNINDLNDKDSKKFFSTLDARSFLMGYIANPNPDHTSGEIKYSGQRISATDFRERDHYLIIIDKQKPPYSFETYEVRILKSFIQTVSVIFENMVLYTYLYKLYKVKAEESIRDELTNLYNYRHFRRELEKEANRSKRFQSPFSLIMIDIDLFKDFNDTFGHLIGDRILKEVAQLLVNNTRKTDTVARYGGEEFGVILPGLKRSEAVGLANKLRSMVEQHVFDVSGITGKQTITISAGVASFPEDSRAVQTLIELSDKALYTAKQSGRNKVCTVK
ncbi:MAG: diguanylate cyclase [Caldithrix sp.]|nr:diguanylate cyclase [Caldithrix sp.]